MLGWTCRARRSRERYILKGRREPDRRFWLWYCFGSGRVTKVEVLYFVKTLTLLYEYNSITISNYSSRPGKERDHIPIHVRPSIERIEAAFGAAWTANTQRTDITSEAYGHCMHGLRASESVSTRPKESNKHTLATLALSAATFLLLSSWAFKISAAVTLTIPLKKDSRVGPTNGRDERTKW